MLSQEFDHKTETANVYRACGGAVWDAVWGWWCSLWCISWCSFAVQYKNDTGPSITIILDPVYKLYWVGAISNIWAHVNLLVSKTGFGA